MYGVAGILLFDGTPERLSRIESMTAAMAHRGPDDEGYVFCHRLAAHPHIETFTLAFEGARAGHDELPQARATAAMLPLNHRIMRTRPGEILGDLEDMAETFEEPYHSLSANYLIARFAAENGVTGVLSGLGGDELFAGYNRQRWWRLWRMSRPFRKLLRPVPMRRYKARRLQEMAFMSDVHEYYVSITSIAPERDKRALFAGVAEGLIHPSLPGHEEKRVLGTDGSVDEVHVERPRHREAWGAKGKRGARPERN